MWSLEISIRYAWLPRLDEKDKGWSYANRRIETQMRDSKLPFLINDNISFTKLTSLLHFYNIDAYVCNV